MWNLDFTQIPELPPVVRLKPTVPKTASRPGFFRGSDRSYIVEEMQTPFGLGTAASAAACSRPLRL